MTLAKHAVITLLLLHTATTLPAQERAGGRPAGAEAALDRHITALTASFEIPALSVAIVTRGEVLYSKGFGRLNLTRPTPNSPTALFHMASVTKPFVATAIMQLVEQGAIALDDPVVKHLPYFTMASGAYQQITIRQMLSHVSGMPDETDYAWESPSFDDNALERYVRGLSTRAMIAAPGTKRAYSNIAFEVLGDLIAKVSGTSFEQYVASHVLVPAGMTSSTLLYAEARGRALASPHLVDGQLAVSVSKVFPYNRMHAPSSTLYSNADDMARWLRVLLNDGTLDGKTILTPSSLHEMWRAHFAAARGEVGLGWMLGDDEGEPTIYHQGRDTGFASFLILYPKLGIGIALMTNGEDLPINRLVAAARQFTAAQEITAFVEPVTQPMLKSYRTGGVEAALQTYQALKQSAPTTISFSEGQLASLGNHLANFDKVPDAVRILEYNLGLFPTSLHTMELLAELYANTAETAKAKAILQRMLAIEPDNAAARAMYDRLLKSGPKRPD